MNFDTIVTYVDKLDFVNKNTGEGSTMCRVVLQVPITKNVKKPYEMGTEGVSFFLNHQYYENFKKIYLEGAKINVDIAFRKVYNVNDKKTSYKPYIKAVNHKDL